MLSLTQHINEKLNVYINEKLNVKSVNTNHTWFVPKNLSELEQYIEKQKDIYGSGTPISPVDVSYIDFSKINSGDELSFLFDSDRKIEYINASNWKFCNNCELENIFSDTQLKYIDVTNWDLSNVWGLHGIFAQNMFLKQINGLDTWDTSNLSEIRILFVRCPKLKTIDLSNWNLSKCEKFRRVFKYCTSLENVGDTSNWKLDNCIDLNSLFEGCTSLKTIKGIENWNVSNCISLTKCFKDCKNLKIDITNWQINQKCNYDFMLENCPSKWPKWYHEDTID